MVTMQSRDNGYLKQCFGLPGVGGDRYNSVAKSNGGYTDQQAAERKEGER